MGLDISLGENKGIVEAYIKGEKKIRANAEESYLSLKRFQRTPPCRLGASTIGKHLMRTRRINSGITQLEDNIFLSLYPNFLAIASGATPIGSTGHVPDDNG
jgi:hypothetical protein